VRGDCLLKHVTEGKIGEMGRRGRRRKQLLDGLQEAKRCWKLKVKALGLILWRTHFDRDKGPVVRQSDVDDDARHLERILLYDKNSVLSMRRPFLRL
jgi:hypothetical protein